MKKKLYILFLLIITSLSAQVFPVQVNPQLIPPYSLTIPEYTNANREQLALNLLLTDISEINRAVTLRFTLSNTAGFKVESAPVVVGALPVNLSGGIPLRLTNADLQPYFEFQNLVGISPDAYGRALSDGLYQFCFQVFDAQSGQQISRQGCATAFLVLNDPPFLNTPSKGEIIAEQNPQNIIFQWTPRHLNATNVEYEFTLVELWDELQDPQTSFLVGRPYFQTTTRATTLLYGPADPGLLSNKSYAWRVRAMVSDGISQASIFKNNGYSEIYHFEYNGECLPPQFAITKPKTKNTQTVQWQGGNYLEYNLQYRKKDGASNEWFSVSAFSEQANIFNLEEDTTYEYRVGAQCRANGGFSYGNISEFTTAVSNDEAAGYECGILPDIQITNQEPLTRLGVNEVFTAGDFPVTVKYVDGSNGIYTGEGYITVPYLADTRIKVVFNNVKINSDYQLTDGTVETDYNPDNLDNLYDISGEIDLAVAVINFATESVMDLLEDVANKIREGELTGKDTDGVLENIKDDLNEEDFEKLKEANETKKDLENQLAEAETEEEKEGIRNQISAIDKEIADKIEEVNEDIADLIIKALEKYYSQNRSQESNLVSAYDTIYDFESGTSSETSSDQDSFEEGLEFESEEEIEINNVPEEFIKVFDIQEKYHLYFFTKSVAEDKEDKEVIRQFVVQALEAEIDLVKIMKESMDDGDSENNTIDILVISIEKALKELIDKYKYNYLD